MTIDIDKLEQLARAATKGPWRAEHDDTGSTVIGQWKDLARFVCRKSANDEHDAAYVAAANPAVVLELLARLRAAERQAVFAKLIVDDFAKETAHRAAKAIGGQHVGHTNNVFTSAPPSVMSRFAREMRDAGIEVQS